MRRILSRIKTCGICFVEELTEQAYLPKDWIVTDEHPTTICRECLDTWVKRFGEEPEYYMKGGEEDIL